MASGAQEHAVATRSGAKASNESLIQREIKYFRDFSAIYTDAIRSSDFKANIALLLPAAVDGPDLERPRKEPGAYSSYGWCRPFSWPPIFFSYWQYFQDTSGQKKAHSICPGPLARITSPSSTIPIFSWKRSGIAWRCCHVSYGGRLYT